MLRSLAEKNKRMYNDFPSGKPQVVLNNKQIERNRKLFSFSFSSCLYYLLLWTKNMQQSIFCDTSDKSICQSKKNLAQILSRKTIHCVISSWYPHVIPIHMICNQTNKEQRMFCNIYIVSYRWRNDNRM